MAGTILMGCSEFQENQVYHGFKLVEKRFVKEVNAECLYFQHVKSGARLLKIAADDANKTFSIAFKTLPESDAGTPHIMEHSVLNGSKNFPVKSPFDVLAKGSLNTFLNAMTGGDITIYPIASMNNKDYFNLMHVYLDAVFYPLIYDDPRILKQEGWHHELMAENEPVVYKGVVYNEMKGAFSSPTRELGYQIDKHLFPDNSYGFSSGGYPAAIPSLTYEAFIDFHKTYYHPSNSYIFLYGNADLNKELEFIDREYLSNFEKSDATISIPLQKPFGNMKTVTGHYSAAEGSDTKDQTYLALNYVAGLNTDQKLGLALRILTNVLVNQESAPIRLALKEAGIGRDVRAYLDNMKQNVIQLRVQNANPEQQQEFHDIVQATLKDAVASGLDREAVDGTLNRIEFRLREGDDAQKGLSYNFQILNTWFFAEDPFAGLEYEKPLAAIKEAIDDGYLEEVIQKYLIDNPHALLMVLEPKPGREKEINEQVRNELKAFKKALSADEKKALINESNELIAYQKREDEPEALATIPLLTLQDIDPEIEWYPVEADEVSGTPLLHYDIFTNDVVYLRLYYDVRVLPGDLIPYASLLAEILGSMNTKNYTFGELDKALDLHTGGFSTFITTYLEDRSDENLIPKFLVYSRAMKTKMDKMFELTDEVITNTIYDDPERLKDVLTRHQSQLDADIKSNGLGYARTRMSSYFSREGMFNEMTDGVTYYKFITDLTERYDEMAPAIIKKLTETASLLFSKNNLVVSMTGSKSDVAAFKNHVTAFLASQPEQDVQLQSWEFDAVQKNEALMAASKVQYVLQGYDYKKLGFEWNGKMRVMNQIVSRDWLTNQIRVIGGAYGGFSSFSPNGLAYFGSYRDPNLNETLENFDGTAGYVKEFQADSTDMTRYIIGTIARMDRPYTPSQKGNIAFRNYFENLTPEALQKERDEVLSTTPEDIRNMENLISAILEKDTYCVYGNEGKIKENKNLFNAMVNLD